MKNEFNFEACMEYVKHSVETDHADPVRELGESIVRAEQDPFFNKTMIDAWREYIRQNGVKWNDRPAAGVDRNNDEQNTLDDIRADLADVHKQLEAILAALGGGKNEN